MAAAAPPLPRRRSPSPRETGAGIKGPVQGGGCCSVGLLAVLERAGFSALCVSAGGGGEKRERACRRAECLPQGSVHLGFCTLLSFVRFFLIFLFAFFFFSSPRPRCADGVLSKACRASSCSPHSSPHLPLPSLAYFPPLFMWWADNPFLRSGLYQLSPLCCSGRSRGVISGAERGGARPCRERSGLARLGWRLRIKAGRTPASES